jgi:hypothetical protein
MWLELKTLPHCPIPKASISAKRVKLWASATADNSSELYLVVRRYANINRTIED